jgi:DNA ligase 1
MPIERRTCRHLRAYRGEHAEEMRLGGKPLPANRSKPQVKAPPLLLAETWDGELDPRGYLLSVKVDGIRAFWDGKQFLTRNGHKLFAPSWFTVGLPLEPLDGELWIAVRSFQRTVSIVKRQDESILWNEVRFVIFDAPAEEQPFEKRLKWIDTIMEVCRPPFAVPHPHVICEGREHLESELDRVTSVGGEGLMLRQSGSAYEAGRSKTLLKVKRFRDAEAIVIGHEPGTGRHSGRMGALLVEMANGVQFAVGTGFTDAQREEPAPIGSEITFRYFDLSDSGVPRFASFLRVNTDRLNHYQGENIMATTTSTNTRRFEFVGGGSDKFWEVTVNGSEVLVRFGRNGTNGQSTTKNFADQAAAEKHAAKQIREKLGKGYVEVN